MFVFTEKGCGDFCESCSISREFKVDCLKCKSDTFKYKKDDISKCKSCSNSINGIGCKKCKDSSTCLECLSKSYMLIDNSCVKCTNIHSKCAECSKNKCTKCKEGYFLKSNSCEICPRNCIDCGENEGVVNCIKCKSYYTVLKSKACDVCPNNCRKCQVIQGKLSCQICQKQFTKSSEGICVKCPDNCNECFWNSVKSVAYCSGNNQMNSCFKNVNGKYWTKNFDGGCSGIF